MKKMLKFSISILFLILVSLMLISNLLHFNCVGFVLCLLFLLGMIFCSKLNLDKRILNLLFIILIILGVATRIFLIYDLDFELSSDFRLYYDTAVAIAKEAPITEASYLSYNGYVVVFSSILAIFFRLFGASIQNALLFNLLCQIGTCIILYKIIVRFRDRTSALVWTAVWFSLPPIVFAGTLISTETLFMFLFSVLLDFYFKINRIDTINIKNIFLYMFFGFLISFCNYIRPVMSIFIIALIITFILKSEKIKKYVFLSITVVTFSFGNVIFDRYIENTLDEPIRSGALSWSIFYGSNYEYRGYWNLEDSSLISQMLEEGGSRLLLNKSVERYLNMGPLKIAKFFGYKFYYLWTDLNANFDFLGNISNGGAVLNYYNEIYIICYAMFIVLLVATIYRYSITIRLKNDGCLLIELFTIGYILANLIVVVNGRYNYPIFLIFTILYNCDGKKVDSMISYSKESGSVNRLKEKFTKLINVYKKYGFIGFWKKLYAYVVANYLNKFSIKVLLCPSKYRDSIKSILDDCDYDRIILWRSSFGYQHPLWQRPQHILNNLRKRGCLVFYEVTTMTDKVKTLKKEDDNLYLFNFNNIKLNKILMEELKKYDKPKYIQLYCTDWKLSVKNIEDYFAQGFKLIYEYVDDLSPDLAGTKELPRSIMEKYEYAMKNEDVYVVVTAKKLEEDVLKKRGKKNLAYSSNGVDYPFFETFDENYVYESEFQKVLDKKKPIVMYYGAIAKWFDYDLIKKIDATNKYSIVLFGIKYDDALDESGILDLKNVFFMGPRDYKVLKNYARCADVLTIPFKINSITEATSPVKIFEYMALHRPIVITDLNECRKYKSVMIAHNHDEFIKFLDDSLTKVKDKKYIELLDKEARENDWSYKAKAIIDLIRKDEK